MNIKTFSNIPTHVRKHVIAKGGGSTKKNE